MRLRTEQDEECDHAAREERETGREVCPKCDSDNTHAGYGMAAGGIGCYTICMDCGYVLASVQDPEP